MPFAIPWDFPAFCKIKPGNTAPGFIARISLQVNQFQYMLISGKCQCFFGFSISEFLFPFFDLFQPVLEPSLYSLRSRPVIFFSLKRIWQALHIGQLVCCVMGVLIVLSVIQIPHQLGNAVPYDQRHRFGKAEKVRLFWRSRKPYRRSWIWAP